MFHYITYLYNTIKNYFNDENINTEYTVPFNTIENDNNDEFMIFKNNDIDINKVIFALNNLPDKIHNLLFNGNSEICNKYFYITIKIQNKKIIDLSHNLDDINDYLDNSNNTRYIFIRVNIINTLQNIMQHVNCIIIDKVKKYILFFEPKFEFSYNIDELEKVIDELVNLHNYSKIFPQDIGYNYYDRLQFYDAFCQSYVLFVFIIITNNELIDAANYSLMLNKIITYENLGYMLYHINTLLKQSGYEICEQKIIWSFPTKKTQNMLNIIHLFLNNYKQKQQIDKSNELEIETEIDEDFIIINIQTTI